MVLACASILSLQQIGHPTSDQLMCNWSKDCMPQMKLIGIQMICADSNENIGRQYYTIVTTARLMRTIFTTLFEYPATHSYFSSAVTDCSA